VNPVTGVRRALKCRKLTPRFVGPFEIVEKVIAVAYRIALPPSLSNLHDVFHVSKLRKYVYDESHVIQVDELEVRDNLTVETWPVRIEDRVTARFSRLFLFNYFIVCIILIVCIFMCLCI